MGSPRPSAKASIAPASPCLPSLLLATSITGLLALRAKSAKARSLGVRPMRASITKNSASACAIAASVCSCMRAVSEPLAPSSRPAVSMIVKSRPPSLASPSRGSRVTPGTSSTSPSFYPTRRLNSVDLPTLGRPIMAILKDMGHSCAAGAAPVNEMKKSAREAAARHRCREGALRLLLGGLGRLRLLDRLIGRRRGGALAHDLLPGRRSGRGRRGLGLGLAIDFAGGRPGRRDGRTGRLPGLFRLGTLRRLGWLGQRLGGQSRDGGAVRIGLLLRALVHILRNALLKARHAFREHRLAVARQLLLGIEEVEHVARIEAGATAQHAREGDQDGGCDQAWRAAHIGISSQLSAQLFATGGSRACSASARERRPGGVSPSSAIASSHLRAAVVSLLRQADSASISRAVWRKVDLGEVEASSRCCMSA